MSGQSIEFGKYRLCYDMYWRCHFQNLIELKADSTYEFIYLDDTQRKTTRGVWRIDSNFVVLTPAVIPDTIKIVEVFEAKNRMSKVNIVSISEYFKCPPNIEISIFQKGVKTTFETDSICEFQYSGGVADSITLKVKGREFEIKPKKEEIPSIIRINIETNHKDLIYNCLGTNKIMLKDGRMFIKYKDVDIDGNESELKTEYFEYIK